MTLFSLLLIVQIIVSVSIVSLVMLQQGKGADMGAAFGSGASGTVFGSRGSGSFFTRATAILGFVFFANCLLIASPLIQTGDDVPSSLGAQLEEKSRAEKRAEDAINEAAPVLEQASDFPGDDIPGDAVSEGDGYNVPATDAMTDVPAASDLPE